MNLARFFLACARDVLKGGNQYRLWITLLLIIAIIGAGAYYTQFQEGLIVTGMSDQVSWGVYIANFTFLVGLAAAAVMLVIPAYIFHQKEAHAVVLLAEGVAVAACIMCILFVVVDLGRPDRFWHMIPGIGMFNWPKSLLAWDVIVLNGYLALNITIPLYILYTKYKGGTPNPRIYFPGVLISIFWAISIHTVTAFLYSSMPARPFWNTALLGPRFIASAFTAGPAFMVLAFRIIKAKTTYNINDPVIHYLALVAGIALQISLFMVGAELFTEFYAQTQHAASAQFLFFGIDGFNSLVPFIWFGISIEIVAMVIFMVHRWRNNFMLLNIACVFAIVGIWIEKGIGLVIPGFIPTPLGELFEYPVTLIETLVCLGIWAIGILIFTLLAKTAISIEQGQLKLKHNVSPRRI